MSMRSAPYLGMIALAQLAGGCTQTLDAGHNVGLPVDGRNPILLYQDDWSADWLPEYAALLAKTEGLRLGGIIVNATPFWGDVTANANGWRDFVDAARASGLQNLPVVTASTGRPLARPTDGQIDSTLANDSEGARVIVEVSRQLSTLERPLVVVSATSLTDIADAYLIDHSVVDRVVVVAALGSYVAPNGIMDGPNGDMDAWADWIVAQRFRYVQVSGYYDQSGDVTAAQLDDLPRNPFGDFMRRKHPNLILVDTASDQIALLSVALPRFATAIRRCAPDTSAAFDPEQGPPLVPDASGNAWVVTSVDGALAASRLWAMLRDPRTFAP
jgi:hypothetical protein